MRASDSYLPLSIAGIGELDVRSGTSFAELAVQLSSQTASIAGAEARWFVGTEALTPAHRVGSEPLTFGARITRIPVPANERAVGVAGSASVAGGAGALVGASALSGTGALGELPAGSHGDAGTVMRQTAGPTVGAEITTPERGRGWARVEQGVWVRTGSPGASGVSSVRVRLSWRWHAHALWSALRSTFRTAASSVVSSATDVEPRSAVIEGGLRAHLILGTAHIVRPFGPKPSVRRLRVHPRAWLWGLTLSHGVVLELEVQGGASGSSKIGEVVRYEPTVRWNPGRFGHEPAPEQPTYRESAAVMAVSVVVPLAISALLAAVMQQPTFLLFGLAGPLMIVAQHLARRKSAQPAQAASAHESAPRTSRPRLWELVLAIRDPSSPHIAGALAGVPAVMAVVVPCTDAQAGVGRDERDERDVRASAHSAARAVAREHVIRALAGAGSVEVEAGSRLDTDYCADKEADVEIVASSAAMQNWEFLRWRRPRLTNVSSWAGREQSVDRPALTVVDLLDLPAPHATLAARLVQAVRESARAGAHLVVLCSRELAASVTAHPEFRAAVVPVGVGAHNANLDALSPELAEELVVGLGAHLLSTGAGASRLPSSAPLVDALSSLGLGAGMGVGASLNTGIGAQWGTNSPGALTVPVGIGEDGSALWLDLVAQGPHMLVAGTTGSGKSEFLQSLVFGAAARYSPVELHLVLVDYKGGAGLGAAAQLPHTISLVTDLDPSESGRALVGLRKELQRRERLFAEHSITRIEDYNRRLGLGSLARLLIVVDEFRALADDQPDFIPSLVRLAAQGRSLGIHLVLATQRPSGAITPDMRANITLRACLRVADEADSLDVLGVPDGAAIPASLPGRVLVRVGSEPLIRAQSFLCGAPPRGSAPLVRALSRWHVPLVAPAVITDDSPDTPDPLGWYMAELSRAPIYERPRALWAPPLPERWVARSGGAGVLGASPDSLTHLPLVHSLGAHCAVLGRARSGKTTALLSLVRAALEHADLEQTATLLNRSAKPVPHGVPQLDAIPVTWIGPRVDHPMVRSELGRLVGASLICVDSSDAFLIHGALTSALERPGLIVLDTADEVIRELEAFDRGSGLELIDILFTRGRRAGASLFTAHGTHISRTHEPHISTRIVLGTGNSHDDVMWGVPKELAGLPSAPGRGVWIESHQSLACQFAVSEHTSPDEVRSKDPLNGELPHWEALNREDFLPPRAHPTPAGGAAGTYGFSPKPLAWHGDNLVLVGKRGAKRTASATRLIAGLSAHAGEARVLRVSSTDSAEQLRSATSALEGGQSSKIIVSIEDLDLTTERNPYEVGELLAAAYAARVPVLAQVAPTALANAYGGALGRFLQSCAQGLWLEPGHREREFLGVPVGAAIDPAGGAGYAVYVESGRAHPARLIV